MEYIVWFIDSAGFEVVTSVFVDENEGVREAFEREFPDYIEILNWEEA